MWNPAGLAGEGTVRSRVDLLHDVSDTSYVPRNHRIMQQDARLTIRLPARLREALGSWARAEQRSLSAQVLKILDDAATSDAAINAIAAYRQRRVQAAKFEQAMFGEPPASPRFKRKTKQ